MRNVCLIPLVALLAGCDADAPAPRDSARVPVVPDSSVASDPAAPPSNWNVSAGPALLVAGEQLDRVIVVSPDVHGVMEPGSLDVADLAGANATLIGRGGAAFDVTLGGEVGTYTSMSCNSWPVMRAPEGTSGWSVGFLEHSVTPIALDSVHAMTRRDSLALVSLIARLASGLAVTRTGEHAGKFHGLPFVVTDVRRLSHDSVEIAIAQVVRRVNQEASPLEEHILIIAERKPGAEWRVANAERSAGREESVARREVLAAASVDAEPMVVLVHDSGSEVRYVIRWRSGGTWKRSWSSATSRC